MDLLLHSPELFIYRTGTSILPSSSPAQHFNPARMTREIKKLRLRHDERGSQQSAGCGQVKGGGGVEDSRGQTDMQVGDF